MFWCACTTSTRDDLSLIRIFRLIHEGACFVSAGCSHRHGELGVQFEGFPNTLVVLLHRLAESGLSLAIFWSCGEGRDIYHVRTRERHRVRRDRVESETEEHAINPRQRFTCWPAERVCVREWTPILKSSLHDVARIVAPTVRVPYVTAITPR